MRGDERLACNQPISRDTQKWSDEKPEQPKQDRSQKDFRHAQPLLLR